MTIESISALAAIGGDMRPSNAIDVAAPKGVDFMSMLGNGLERVDASLQSADAQLRGLAAGEAVSVHEVMISMERARMDLMLVAEVRNRLVEAYQELTRMQL